MGGASPEVSDRGCWELVAAEQQCLLLISALLILMELNLKGPVSERVRSLFIVHVWTDSTCAASKFIIPGVRAAVTQTGAALLIYSSLFQARLEKEQCPL